MNFQSVLTQQQHQYAMQQRQQRTNPASSPTAGSRGSQAGDGGSRTGAVSVGGNSSGSFVTRIRQAPSKSPALVNNNISVSQNSSNTNSSAEATPTNSPMNGVTTQAKAGATHVTMGDALNGSGKWAVNERRLAQWQQQPFNLSPATHLNLEPMLPPPRQDVRQRPLLVLDVDETLVHASFTPAKPFHVKITIHVDGETGDIFVAYRPHLFTFLDAILPLFEVAIFTASQSCYADQLMDAIDPQGRLGRLRLFREHCTEVNGARVKDLSLLGRPLHRIALIDNSPVTYLFQPRNAIPILSWFDDPRDTELLKLLPMLRQLAQSSSVYDVLDLWNCSSAR